MKNYVMVLILILIFMMASPFIELAMSQPPPPDPDGVPIDGGLGFLLAAGMLYGAKKLRSSQQEITE